MSQKNGYLSFEHFHKVLTILGKCTDDYLYIYDMQKDEYTISESAVQRFALDSSQFGNAGEILQKVCYPDDYPRLSKNINALKSQVITEHNMEYRWLGKNGQPVWINCRGQIILNETGKVHYMVGRITELGRRNVIDDVTALYREMKLCDDLTEMVEKEQCRGFLLRIGIDNFREINDKYGKNFGDEVLSSVADSIRQCISSKDTVYRMDGDEMIILVKDIDQNTDCEDEARDLYHSIRSRVDEAISQKDYQHFCTISGGSVYFADKLKNIYVLIEQSEFALHCAKQRGKNTYIAYDQEEYEIFVKKLDMQERLRESVTKDFRGFELYYQPIVNIHQRKILGAEALLRWNDEVFGRVSPVDFIPLLEESGLIIPVGRWIIDEAMNQCLEWQKVNADFRININLSFIQIKKSNIIQDIDGSMKKLHFKSRNVLFEVTESGELEEGYMTKRILQSFQRRKLNLGIDDFGTGYSNLRYIKEMMFDLVKIDREFIRNITESQYDFMVVKQFTELAHSLKLRVCYEGVETKEQLQRVLELDPDYIQGYYFAKPVSADTFETEYLNKDLEEYF